MKTGGRLVKHMLATTGCYWPRDISTGSCLARCCGGFGRCLCRVGNRRPGTASVGELQQAARGRGVAQKPSAVTGTVRSPAFEG